MVPRALIACASRAQCLKGHVCKGRSIDSLCSDVHGAMIACAFKAPKWLH